MSDNCEASDPATGTAWRRPVLGESDFDPVEDRDQVEDRGIGIIHRHLPASKPAAAVDAGPYGSMRGHR
jgi:hypothetical protein